MFRVVVRNPGFRKLWLAQVVGQAGDWMNRMAVLELIRQLGGPGAMVGVGALYGAELAVRLLPAAILGPIAGPLADRLPRRAMMVITDLARFFVVLAILTVDSAEELPRLFALVLLQMGLAHFFNTARGASVPNTVPREELHDAHALSAATWSTMLTVGSLVGAALLEPLGVRGVLVADAATYIVSALLLIGLRLPPVPVHAHAFRWREILFATELRRGWRHVRELHLAPTLLAKTLWGGAGGFLVMFPIVADERFASAFGLAAGSAGATGALYAARGLGTGLGPVLARWRLGSSEAALRRQIAGGYIVGALGYALFAICDNLALALACVVFAHMGGSALWVASTVFWQRRVADAYRGRVFALEFLGMTLSFAAGGLGAGWLYDATGSSAWTLWACCGTVLVCGAVWHLWARASDHPPEPDPQPEPGPQPPA